MTKDTFLPIHTHTLPKQSPHSEETARRGRAREEKLAAALRRNLLRRKGKSSTLSSPED